MRQNIYNLQKGFKTKITKNPTEISSAKEIYARFLMIFVPSFFIAACSTSEPPVEGQPDGQQRTPIELSVGIIGEGSAASTRTATRNVVTVDKPYNQYAKAFDAATSLYMVMKSDDGGSTPGASKYTSTIGTAQVPVPATEYANNVDFAGNTIRYWEDAHSRNSKLSIYSACVPGKQPSSPLSIGNAGFSTGWGTTAITTTITWPLNNSTSVTTQDAGFIDSQDLCFSNNVSNLSGNAPTDNRIGFGITEANKFDSKLMVFYHALTKITFKIEMGAGFNASTFTFTNGNTEDIVLKNFNTGGTFDIVNGEFTASTVTAMSPVNKLADTKDANADVAYAFVRSVLLVPGTDLNDDTDKDDINSVSFSIAGDTYHITKAQLAKALNGKTLSNNSTPALDDGKMRAGVHYIFTMTVGKKAIDKITAAVVPWEEVTAETEMPSNARITVSLLDRGTHKTGTADFYLYRSAKVYSPGTGEPAVNDDYASYDWTTGYTSTGNMARLVEKTANSGIYTAEDANVDAATHNTWAWPDNKTFYHFRAVSPTTATVDVDATNGDYITLSAAESYTDVCWGAPFKNITNTTDKLAYSLTDGFDNDKNNHQIYKGIGPTSNAINLTMFHMMSEVTIKLETVSGDAGVNLNGAKVSLSNVYPSAKVRMGDGLVTPTGDVTSLGGTVVVVNNEHKWTGGFVSQILSDVHTDGDTTPNDDVILTITLADGNQYIVNMKDMVTTKTDDRYSNIKNPYTVNAGGKYIIDRWYPCFKYTYTFNLTKSGVTGITATLLNWEDVKADEQGIQIK